MQAFLQRHWRLPPLLAFATLGGALCSWIEIPLAWMIGAMLFTMGVAFAGVKTQMPRQLFIPMQTIVGVMLGSTFSPELLAQATQWWLTVLAMAVYTVVGTAVALAALQWFSPKDPFSNFFSATPGGVSQMALLGAEMGAHVPTITVSQSMRIFVVVMTIPLWYRFAYGVTAPQPPSGMAITAIDPVEVAILALCCVVGHVVAVRLRIPVPQLLGPMTLSVLVHVTGLSHASPPAFLIAAAQVVMGTAFGTRFNGVSLASIARTAWVAVVVTLLLMVVAFLFAIVMHWATGIGLPELVLAFAPGGMAEMSLVALALGTDVPFVSTHHAIRIFIVLGFAPLALKVWRWFVDTKLRPRQAISGD